MWATVVSDTIKMGTLSKNRKNCLDLENNETKIPTACKVSNEASDVVQILRLGRDRLGISPVTTALTNFSDKTSHPTKAIQPLPQR